MKKLAYELKELCKHNRDGSHETQYKRKNSLLLMAHQLEYELGYPRMGVTSLKEKHVVRLINHWQQQGLAISTIKARMSFVRWWAEKVNKSNIIDRDNSHYGIGRRQYVPTESKACDIDFEKLKTIKDPYVVASVKLVQEFGLRKEEAIKFTPKYADKGDYILLKSSWCKGGKERTVPILTQAQREALNHAWQVAGNGSLIPTNKLYSQQKNRYEKLSNKAGFKKLHGLRHRYAQLRYEALTGWKCFINGGPKTKELTPEQKRSDKEARLIISRELGHERLQVTVSYIG